MFNANVGNVDRGLRAVIGVGLIATPLLSQNLIEPGTATIVSIIAGAILLTTSTMKFCPIYKIFGLKTCNDT
ncbi:DUF2892 domain-containing protein [Kordiimonas sp. SCSIO 12610]|uniref:YgaP family membrane protein n=1 Tax=Kordiimonas sp. SCSIO 12610 TaxID=2829597 RepID=UPI00210B8C77|nr:DUF2892 domain-containing protein [Kordiimonas sp. SCSIO 12610]UTW54655.1 DUF2892 domain-containing protein [Kordiimonas sp. SCSIO 12610]